MFKSCLSSVLHLLSKACNRFDVIKIRGLHLSLTMLQLDIQKLASLHQPQESH